MRGVVPQSLKKVMCIALKWLQQQKTNSTFFDFVLQTLPDNAAVLFYFREMTFVCFCLPYLVHVALKKINNKKNPIFSFWARPAAASRCIAPEGI